MSGTRLAFIPAQFIKVATAHRLDLDQYLVAGVHIVPNADARVRLWKVNLADLTNGGEVAFVNDIGKDDSVALTILTNGDVLVTISEALPGASGSTAQPEVYRIPGVFAPYVPGTVTARDAALRTALAGLPK